MRFLGNYSIVGFCLPGMLLKVIETVGFVSWIDVDIGSLSLDVVSCLCKNN